VLPLRDANPAHRTPFVTIAIVAVNLAAFVLWQPTFMSGPDAEVEQQLFYFCEAAIPWEVVTGENLVDGGPPASAALDATFGPGAGGAIRQALQDRCPDKSVALSLVVAMFLHGGWLHLLGNLLFLWIFGNNVEDQMGHLPYLIFYLLGGFAAFGLQFVLDTGSVIPTLGASGAIAAVLGAYLYLFPGARVLTGVFFFVITVIELPAVVVLGVWFVLQFFSGLSELGREVDGGVAYWAHVGGFAFGFLVAATMLRRRRRPAPGRSDDGPLRW
jgi:membrane associated rhomboid family serine protease